MESKKTVWKFLQAAKAQDSPLSCSKTNRKGGLKRNEAATAVVKFQRGKGLKP